MQMPLGDGGEGHNGFFITGGMALDHGSSVEGKSNQQASSFQQMQPVSCMKYKIKNITFGIGGNPLEWTLQ